MAKVYCTFPRRGFALNREKTGRRSIECTLGETSSVLATLGPWNHRTGSRRASDGSVQAAAELRRLAKNIKMIHRLFQISVLLLIFSVLEAGVRADSSAVPAISREAAILDSEIPDSVRKKFDDDDGRPMKSVSIDLNNDKVPEKLIPNEFLCGNGGCPWLIYSPTLNKVIGDLFGKAIVVLDTSNEGYKSIQTYWRLGPDIQETAVYKFQNGSYKKEK